MFISSVVEGFGEYRQAAREGAEAAGTQAILVTEDFPSLATSSRNACLDAVESSDIFVAIVGSRGGWRTPSGRLVVEEEYAHARRQNLPTMVFVQQDVERDQDAEQWVRQLSDYVDGRFRIQFRTADELRSAVEQALRGRVEHLGRPSVSPQGVNERLQRPNRVPNETALHFVLMPERAEEVVDPVRFDDQDFRHDLYEVGHRRDVRLFTYEASKDLELGRDLLVIDQQGERRRDHLSPAVRLEIETSGRIAIDSAVTGRSPPDVRGVGMESMMIGRPDVEDTLRTDFSFASAFYDKVDPYRRHEQFLYGVAVTGVTHKKWVEEVRPTNAMTFGGRQRPDPLILLPEPRAISRDALRQPEKEIERLIMFARRELGS